MAAKIIFTFDADNDIASAYDWYENQRLGLGEELLKRIHAAAKDVCEFPTA